MEPIYETKEECIESLADAFYVRSTHAKCPDTNRCYDCRGTDEQARKCALATANMYWNRIEDILTKKISVEE